NLLRNLIQSQGLIKIFLDIRKDLFQIVLSVGRLFHDYLIFLIKLIDQCIKEDLDGKILFWRSSHKLSEKMKAVLILANTGGKLCRSAGNGMNINFFRSVKKAEVQKMRMKNDGMMK